MYIRYLHKRFTYLCLTQFRDVYTIYTVQGLFQSRLGTADYALVTSSLHYNDSLDTWTVVHMTAAKLKPLIFSVSGFAWSIVANVFIFMILDWRAMSLSTKATNWPHVIREFEVARTVRQRCSILSNDGNIEIPFLQIYSRAKQTLKNCC
jgi:hypothetical protein